VDDVLEPVAQAAPVAYAAPPEWRDGIARALCDVVDPELAISIADLGLAYAVRLAGDTLHVRLTMTSAACPVADLIVADLEEALARAVPPDVAIAVDLAWEPPWTPGRMSERARRCLNP
jgi:metal-sulfur cluster biosynthetic enzyme